MDIPADQIVPLAQLIGLGLLGIVAAFGLWYGKRVPTPAEKTLEVAGALVDSGSVKQLAAAIEAHTLELITQRADADRTRKLGHELIEAIRALTGEVEEVRRSADTLAREISRAK